MQQSDTTEGAKMFRAVVLFCAVLALTKGEITQVNQCTGSLAPLPLLTIVEGCRTPPCDLTQGQEASISIVFQAPYAMQEMRTRVVGYLAHIGFPFELGEYAETCNYLSNSSCPVREGDLIVYTTRAYVPEYMPAGTQVPIEFRIVDDNNVAVTCTRVPIRILPPLVRQL